MRGKHQVLPQFARRLMSGGTLGEIRGTVFVRDGTDGGAQVAVFGGLSEIH